MFFILCKYKRKKGPYKWNIIHIYVFSFTLRIIQDNKGWTTYFKRELFEKVQDKFD